MIEPKTRYVYRLQSRNLSVGVYREIDSGESGISRGFTGIRTKFGARYLDTEVWKEPPGKGTVTPLRVYLGRDALTDQKRWTYKTFKGGKREVQRALAAMVADADGSGVAP